MDYDVLTLKFGQFLCYRDTDIIKKKEVIPFSVIQYNNVVITQKIMNVYMTWFISDF